MSKTSAEILDVKGEHSKMLSLMNVIIKERDFKTEKRRDIKAKGKQDMKNGK